MWVRAASSTASSGAGFAWWAQCRGSPGKLSLPKGGGLTKAPLQLSPEVGGRGRGQSNLLPPPPPPRCLQTVQLDRHIQLLDCPGVVMETGAPTAAAPLRGALAPQRLRDPLTPAAAILRRCPPEQVGSALFLGG